jgi:hypothetical protein
VVSILTANSATAIPGPSSTITPTVCARCSGESSGDSDGGGGALLLLLLLSGAMTSRRCAAAAVARAQSSA